MSVSAISTSTLASSVNQSIQNKLRQFQQEFRQLGSDLQTGNSSAAQQDESGLPGLTYQSDSTSAAASSNPIAQAFNQLTQDLQSGNISAAQQDFDTLKQDSQKVGQGHDNLRHPVQGWDAGSSQPADQWGLAPPAANVSNAQAAYGSMLQDLQQVGSGGALIPALTVSA